MFIDAFNKLGMSMEKVGPFHSALVGFAGEQVQVRGHIVLLMTFTSVRTIPVKFLIVERESPYIAILGGPSLNKLSAIMSTPHLRMKFLILNGQC